MANIIRIIGKLPAPKGLRLSWQANLIDRSFRRDIAKLRSSNSKDREKLQLLQHEHYTEMSLIKEDQEAHFTKQLIRQARRLRVYIPNRIGEGNQPTEYWEQGRFQGYWYLTSLGIANVRDEIRKELKWRYDRRAHYTSWVTGIIAIIGTVIGFIAGVIFK